MSSEVYIFTMNQGKRRGRWSRYVFPFVIEHFAHLRDSLYLRHGDIVSKVVEGSVSDDGVNFDAVIQWPWLDFGSPGINKMMHGFDIVNTGTCNLEIGYDQTNIGSFTTSFAIPVDTVPGQIIGFPLNLPSFSVKLTYDGGQAWEHNAFQIYIDDQRPTS